MLRRLLILNFFLIALITTSAQIDVLAPSDFRIIKEGIDYTLPYYASHDIEEDDEEIRKLIVVVHGTNRNADDYFDNMRIALNKRPEQVESTLVIAPQFLREDDIEAFNLSSRYPYWSSDGWKVGANSRDEDYNPREGRIPSYELLDSLILRVANTFSNVEEMVFTGHSAGGQLTNRYTASSPVFTLLCEDYGISSKSIIANPGSYVYMNEKRRVEGTLDQFEIPTDNCPNYNEYSFGLEDLYTYHRRAGSAQMKTWYGEREVVYIYGSEDNDPDATTLPRSCRALLQGRHRLERGLTYYNHTLDHYGEDITDRHRLHVVDGVGHSNFDIYNSDVAVAELFDEAPLQSCQETTSTYFLPNSAFRIHPNPASNFIEIQSVKLTNSIEQIIVYDMMGRLLLTDHDTQIDISSLETGTYILKAESSNQVWVSKFSISKN